MTALVARTPSPKEIGKQQAGELRCVESSEVPCVEGRQGVFHIALFGFQEIRGAHGKPAAAGCQDGVTPIFCTASSSSKTSQSRIEECFPVEL